MLMISSRENFSNPDRLSGSGHQFKEIDLNSDREIKDFPDQKAFLQKIRNKNIFLLVHGYNNEQDEVYDAYSVIEQKIRSHMPGEHDMVIGYSWPGGDRGLDWWASKRRANAVARRFRFLLEEMAIKARTIDIMSHSLGARVTLKALKQSAQDQMVRSYFCAAPAVDNEVLERDEEFHDCIRKVVSLYVFHSRKDRVLATAYRVAEFDNPLGLYGPEDKEYIQNKTRNIFVVNCKKKIDSHGGYKRADSMYQYMARSFVKKPPKFKTL